MPSSKRESTNADIHPFFMNVGLVRSADLCANCSECPVPALRAACHFRPFAAVYVHLRMLQCGPSLRTFVHLAAFWRVKRRSAVRFQQVAGAAPTSALHHECCSCPTISFSVQPIQQNVSLFMVCADYEGVENLILGRLHCSATKQILCQIVIYA